MDLRRRDALTRIDLLKGALVYCVVQLGELLLPDSEQRNQDDAADPSTAHRRQLVEVVYTEALALKEQRRDEEYGALVDAESQALARWINSSRLDLLPPAGAAREEIVLSAIHSSVNYEIPDARDAADAFTDRRRYEKASREITQGPPL